MSDDKTKPEYYLFREPVGNGAFVYRLDTGKVAEAMALLMKERQDRNKDLFQKLDEEQE